MKKVASAQWVPAVFGPSLGLPVGRAAVRNGSPCNDRPAAPAADTTARPEAAEHSVPVTRVPVASTTLAATYRERDYRVVAWQPLGKPAFVFMLAIGERRFLQPNIAEGADFDAVMQNAEGFVKQLLDDDAQSLELDPW